jgi:hypothetical protein
MLTSLFSFRGISKAYYEEASRKRQKMLNYIWIESWSLRQAVRFALNGYDYAIVYKMVIMSVKEIKYKRKQRH